MSEFQKITAITPSFSSKTNALLDEIMADTPLINELHALGISDQEIPHYVTLLISYLDSKKVCDSCKGLSDCQSDSPYMSRSLSMSSNGRLSSCLGPCKFRMAEMTKDMNFLYRDFDPEWNSLSLATIKVERAKELRTAMTKCAKKDATKKWCYVKGESGSGKSYYLAAFANLFASKGKTVAFIDVNKRFDELKNYAIKDKSKFEKTMKTLFEVDYLFIDGLGSEYRSDYVRDQIIMPILSYRSKNSLCTFFSSEFSISEIGALYSKSRADEIISKRLVSLLKKNVEKEVEMEQGIDSYF